VVDADSIDRVGVGVVMPAIYFVECAQSRENSRKKRVAIMIHSSIYSLLPNKVAKLPRCTWVLQVVRCHGISKHPSSPDLSNILHGHRNMVVHVLADVSQEARSDDTDRTKPDAHVVDVLVRLSVSNLAGRNDQFVCARYAANARDHVELFEEGRPGQLDGFFDEQRVGDVQSGHHGAADVVDGCHFELGDEDVVAVVMSVFCDFCSGFVVG
jgi:hypothetical protein